MSLEQMIAGIDALFSKPDFSDSTDLISDLSKASFSISSAEIREHAEYCRERFASTSSRIVIVAPDKVNFGLARMFEILSQLPNVMVVKSMPEAYEWLGIPMES